MGKEITVSAIILTKNSESMIPDCLESLSWVDEIVVVDSGSSDKTESIVTKNKKVRFFVKNLDYSKKRNFGAAKAKGEWIFYIDDDERVTPLLRKEIRSKIENKRSQAAAYAIPRKNILLGHEMKHGGWSPDYVLRLIRKDKLIKWEGELHEQPKIDGKVEKLVNPFTHFSHRSIEEMVEKTNEWSEIEAKLLFKSGHPKMNLVRFFTAGFREFWYRGFRKLGFLDGAVGVIEVFYQTFSRLVTYTKLWEMQKE